MNSNIKSKGIKNPPKILNAHFMNYIKNRNPTKGNTSLYGQLRKFRLNQGG